MDHHLLHDWDLTPTQAVALQRELRERLVLRPPAGLAPRSIGGADVSFGRGEDRAFAGVVVLDAGTLATVEESGTAAELRFPYIPGLLSFRELPAVAQAWERLDRRPDVLIFDGQGYAHPRRLGIASHGGLLFDIPAIGCAKSLLVGRHGPLGEERGSTTPLIDRGEVVGMAVRLRDRVKPVYVSPGHLMDLETAVRIVVAVSAGYREPETTRRAHRLVNRLRRAGGAA